VHQGNKTETTTLKCEVFGREPPDWLILPSAVCVLCDVTAVRHPVHKPQPETHAATTLHYL